MAWLQRLAPHQPGQQGLLWIHAACCTSVVRGPDQETIVLAQDDYETCHLGQTFRSNSITTRIPAELLELILENMEDDDDCIAFGLTCSFFRDVVIEHLRARFKYELVKDPWRGDHVICAGDWNDSDGAHLQLKSLASAKDEIVTATPLDECRCRESRIAEERLHHSSSSARVVFFLSGYLEQKVRFEVYWRYGLNGFEKSVPWDEGEASEQGSETFENV